MKESWWSKNSKWVAPVIAIITFVGGLLIGVYKTTLDYDSEVKTLKATVEIQDKLIDEKIKDAADDVYDDVEDLIQTRILTSFYTKLKNEFVSKNIIHQ